MLALLATAVGLALLFAVVALLCTSAQEFVAQALDKRARQLAAALDKMLTTPGAQSVLGHPLIANQTLSGKLPSYIDPHVFAMAFVDTYALAQKLPLAPATIDQSLAALPPDVQRQLRPFLLEGANDADALLTAVGDWYNRMMDGVSEWYIRWSHRQSFWIGLAMCVALNLDAISITSTLWTQPAVRDGLVALAEKTQIPDNGPGSAAATAQAMAQVLRDAQVSAGVPLGWNAYPAGAGAWGMKLIGFLVSALALSLGARFWFDTLKNLLSLRAGNKPPDPTPPA